MLLLCSDGLCGVLEDAGVFKRTEEGKAAFLRFIAEVNRS